MDARERVTLKQIRYFLAVAEAGSFRRAADRLGVTQPTITAQVAALEEILDTVVFERTRVGTQPTPTGRELIPSARAVLEQAEGFCDLASSVSHGVAGTYRLGVTPTLGPYVLPHILPSIHAEYANLKLYVREAAPNDLEQDVVNARHDLVMTTQPVLSQELVVTPLFAEPLKLVIAKDHRLASKKRINSADLFGEQVLTIGEHHLFHRQITDLCQRVGAFVRRDYEGTSLDTLRQMVVMGMGIAFLPALYVKSEIRARDELRVADVQGISELRNHVLAWRSSSPARGLFKSLAEKVRSVGRERLGDVLIPS
ncbi:MAG: hydrogen peroxide-inducible genes activator [Pseudomonadota bacterium]